MIHKLRSRGDTLVEVLIATVIIGVILIGGYVAVNHNVTVEIQSQERSVALQLDQNQLEKIRTIASTSGGTINLGTTGANPISPSKQFCVDSSDNPEIIASPYLGNCQFNSQGWISGTNPAIPTAANYEIVVSALDGSDWNLIKINATWTELGNSVTDNAKLTYRFYPATDPIATGPINSNNGICGAGATTLHDDEFTTDSSLSGYWTQWSGPGYASGLNYGGSYNFDSNGLHLIANDSGSQYTASAIISTQTYGAGCAEIDVFMPGTGNQNNCWPGLEIWPTGSTTGVYSPTWNICTPNGVPSGGKYGGVWHTFAVKWQAWGGATYYEDDVQVGYWNSGFMDQATSYNIILTNPISSGGFTCSTYPCTNDVLFSWFRIWSFT